jgi:dienelactone hydrolase
LIGEDMKTCTLLLTMLLLGGCAGLWRAPADRVDAQAREGGFQPVAVEGPLKAWLRAAPNASADESLTVYIEGDGAQWRGPYQPPADPTPVNALTLRLALRDPGARVAYAGRPCQNLSTAALADCPQSMWGRARFGAAALGLLDDAVTAIARAAGAARLRLVGFSGGGAMAMLLAARRADVECVVTLAAPLDTDAWTGALDLTPLTQSLNPLHFADRLRFVLQTHFSGAMDTTVPPSTIRALLAASPHARLELLDGYDHDCCWVLAWERLRERSCLAQDGR